MRAETSGIVHLEEVGSTNDWIAAAAARGEPDGLWVYANLQTAGRGRRGRRWVSETGNLFASTLVRSQPGEGAQQQLSFVAALALHDLAATFAPAERLSLKWPNDLMLDGIKCAGLLLESREGTAIVGWGVNLAHHPRETERPANSFRAAGISPPPPGKACARLASAFTARRFLWRSSGFGAIRAAWLARAAGIGKPIVARLGHSELSGVFEGLAEDGALQLRLPSGELRLIHSGETFGL